MELGGTQSEGEFDAEERQILLDIARRSLAERAGGGEWTPSGEGLPLHLAHKRGCFVTLFRHGELRGCIGHVLPQMPLYQAVANNARAAGFNDNRFEPVSATEVDQLEIEISVLSELHPAAATSPDALLAALRPGVDGVLISHGELKSTFLPQVWETLPDKADFLSRLCLKAGWPADAWKGADVAVSTYTVESFSGPPESPVY